MLFKKLVQIDLSIAHPLMKKKKKEKKKLEQTLALAFFISILAFLLTTNIGSSDNSIGITLDGSTRTVISGARIININSVKFHNDSSQMKMPHYGSRSVKLVQEFMY
uniref:Uncharacterized protein n=1 Tax=Glossina brevipalpis TaxID=37001 RepID=A0A1A9W1V0_9MUSC